MPAMAEATLSGLLERDAELAELARLVAEARDRRGGVALVEGPEGSGKTELLAAARRLAPEHGVRALTACASELERDFSFGLVRQLLEPPLATATAGERTALLTGVAGVVGWLAPAAQPRPSAPGDSHATLHGLYWLVVNLAERGPLLLVVDDAHWGDDASLRFLEFLARRLDGLPVALAIVTRTGDRSAGRGTLDEIGRGAGVRLLRPVPLSIDATGELLRRRLGAAATAELAAACHEATRGNPLYLRELALELDAGTGSSLDPAAVRELAPRRISRAILRRLERLPAPATRLARALAVLPDGAPPALAAALAQLEPRHAAELTTALTDAELLTGAPPRFAHPIARASVMDALSGSERASLHARAARLLAEHGYGAEVVALHLLATPPAGDRATVAQLRAGAASALHTGAGEAAVRYLERAREEPPPPDDRALVAFELGCARARAGMLGAIECLTEAVETAADWPLRAQAASELGMALMASWRMDDATRVALEVLESAPGPPAEDPAAGALEALVMLVAITSLSTRRRLIERVRDASAHADRAARNPAMLSALALEAATAGGTAAAAESLAMRALADVDALLEADARSLHVAACALVIADRPDAAEAASERAMAAATARGSARGFAYAASLRALARRFRGDVEGARSDSDGALAMMLEAGWYVLAPIACSCLAEALLERGDLEAAATTLALLDGDRVDCETLVAQPLRLARARLALAGNRPGEALNHLRAIERWQHAWGGRSPAWVPWRSQAALAQLALGDRDEARRLVADEVADARAFGAARPLGIALRIAGRVAGDDSAGLALQREAVAVLERSPARLERARALADLGAALRRTGRRVDARGPLAEAVDEADRCGALVLRGSAGEQLRAAGARPRRHATTGRDALTASELRVARLAADGLSNREIAEALFVTKKTVESHLAHAYRKLGIGARAELNQLLQPPAARAAPLR